MAFATDQEAFWAGEFGDEYTDRNTGARWVASNAALFARALSRAGRIDSILELGANRGLNLAALRILFPEATLTGVEINARAAAELRTVPGVTVHEASLLDFESDARHDLVLFKGVLIHLSPDRLKDAYARAFAASKRYVLIAEYYNPTPVGLSYRGHQDRLFKRDFAGEMLDAHPTLELVDYGFAYRRDPKFPQDDLTWFLLEKTEPQVR